MKRLIKTAERLLGCLLIAGLVTVPVSAESRSKRLLKASWAALVAGNTLDAVSSWHGYEANPLFRDSSGRFGAKGLAIKAGITGTMLALQFRMLKKKPQYQDMATVSNFVMAGAFTAISIHNFHVKQQSAGGK